MSMMTSIPDDALTTAAPVTLCQPGQRSKSIVERVKGGTVPITTATALQPEKVREIVHGQSHERYDASEKARQNEIATLETVVNQPHRRGARDPRDPRLAFPLGRFCARAWPHDPDFANAMFAAGSAYADDVRELKVAQGFHVPGCESDMAFSAPGGSGEASPEEIENQRAEIDGLRRTVEKADGDLRLIMRRLPSAMVALCFDHAEPLMNDEDMLKHGLYALSLLYRTWERKQA